MVGIQLQNRKAVRHVQGGNSRLSSSRIERTDRFSIPGPYADRHRGLDSKTVGEQIIECGGGQTSTKISALISV